LPDFAQEEIFIEDTNFESSIQRLKSSQPTCLTFIFVHVTGRISAPQLRQLVSTIKAMQVIKLVRTHYCACVFFVIQYP
jgi:hypothetical protein